MISRRSTGAGVALVVLFAVAGTSIAAIAGNQQHQNPPPGGSLIQSPTLRVGAIHASLVPANKLEAPEHFACASTTCLLATSTNSGNTSQLWIRRAPEANFAQLPPLAGPRQLVIGVACQSSESCLVIAGSGPSGTNGKLFVTSNAGVSWSAIPLENQMIPASVGCTSLGACWITGTFNGQPEVLESGQSTSWTPVKLPSEPKGSTNQVACAAASNCVDVIVLPGAMIEDEEVVGGGLGNGFTRVLSPMQVAPGDQAACDTYVCYLVQSSGPNAGHEIMVTGVSNSGSTTTLERTTDTFARQLACSTNQCYITTTTAKVETDFLSIGLTLSPVTVPQGLSLDEPSLKCKGSSPECLLVLSYPGVGPTTSYISTLQPSSFRLGSPLSLSLRQGANFVPYGSQLATCFSGACYAIVESNGRLQLLTLQAPRNRIANSFVLRSPDAGVSLLTPIAMACPSATTCELVVQVGSGPYQLMSIDPVTRTTAVRKLPTGVTPESLACTSMSACVMLVGGVSNHHGFPAFWTTNGGNTWRHARADNAINDLSASSVTCDTNGVCVSIGQHDFALGYGTLRPFIARSTDHGASWQLVNLTGPVPSGLPDPAINSIACSNGAGCAAIVATTQRILLLKGDLLSTNWHVQELHLTRQSKFATPYSASDACSLRYCLLTLTSNTETTNAGDTPNLSVRTLIATPSRTLAPRTRDSVISSGLLVAIPDSLRYLNFGPSSANWLQISPN